ncbi:GATA transcription factor 16-like [Impatiens glandulifera]|uniref:GATA transcription factor 16-like n=1 Tax=Impatiens glandulifera TaxID=253017 RepID=UPI001FB10C9D|nr:GATA transcription factor 16-like [Impatiens glandulifera]
MMDTSSDSSEDMIIVKTPDDNVKMCTDCGTTKTPLWRGGPSGPKSLCNACGIRNRKKKRDLLGLNKNSTAMATAAATATAAAKKNGVQKTVKKMKMGEVEQAAVLLMALSGSVFV